MSDLLFLRMALRLARKAQGMTSPNPAVGAVLVKQGKVIGRGRTAPPGGPHAEISAIDAAGNQSLKGATLYVTLEPCCTHGRTPPCTDAIIAAGIKNVVVGAVDPNPKHAGEGFEILQRAGVKLRVAATGFGFRPSAESEKLRALAAECARLNEAFNHWIVQRTPFVTVKAAMTLDGKIATASGESKWITGERAREFGMQLRWQHDAILVGVNTILADDPSLMIRGIKRARNRPLRRIVLDSQARTPLTAKVVCDEFAANTTIVVSNRAPKGAILALARRAAA